MAYTNYSGNNNNGYKKPKGKSFSDNVTTTGYSLDNIRAGKFLNINYWGKTTMIEIGTCPNGVPITWEVKKNAQKLNQVLTYAALSDLCDICEEIMSDIKKSGTFTSTAINVGSKKDSMIEISNGINIGMPNGIYLVIYKGLDQAKKTNIMDVFPFGGTMYYQNYDHNTGSHQEAIRKLGDFKKFYHGIAESVKAFTMAQAHVIEETKKGEKLSTFKAMSAIGAALGVDFSAITPYEKKSNGNSSYNKSNYNGNNYNRKPNNQTFESPNVYSAMQGMQNDPVDINIDMDNLKNVDLSQFK